MKDISAFPVGVLIASACSVGALAIFGQFVKRNTTSRSGWRITEDGLEILKEDGR